MTNKQVQATNKIMDENKLDTLSDPLNVKELISQAIPPKVSKKRYGLGFIRLRESNGRMYYRWVYEFEGKRREKYIGATLPRGVHLGPVTPEMAEILK
jgi:hypothetical protein